MTEINFNIFLWLIILLVFAFVLDNLWKRIFSGNNYRFFLVPGIIIHELSHALICRLVGAKIEEINFFSKTGGYVKYRLLNTHRFIRILSEMFIGFAPIFGGIGALLLFFWLLNLPGIVLLTIDFQQPFLRGLISVIQKIPSFISENWLKWQFWLFIYLIISIIICLVPSKKDIKNALGGILVFFILGLIFYYLGFFPQFLEIIFNPYLGNILVLSSILGFVAIIFSLSVFIFLKMLKYNK